MKTSGCQLQGQTFFSGREGFTLIELLVVLAIMGIMLTLVTLNLNGLSAGRNLRIAQNELVTNIRQMQNFALASRSTPNGKPADFYVIKFNAAAPDQYTLQAIYDAQTAPKVIDVQTVKLPPGIVFQSYDDSAGQYPVYINRPGSSTQYITSSGCALVAFKLPFGKILANNGCYLPSNPNVRTSPPDDYSKFIIYRLNIESDPTGTGSTVSADSTIIISLIDQKKTQPPRMVLIQGQAGLICPTADGSTCQATN
ncbi:MAG TPA: prepilin-type N-terminal cleavage/methylation domain-containing protein [Patescibacteria group bacterium]|nr:prepilin-type N-terminal cleavage/methylation domain-containing protein [Patescibacteria group bacterium]